jgi:hypothetical protein
MAETPAEITILQDHNASWSDGPPHFFQSFLRISQVREHEPGISVYARIGVINVSNEICGIIGHIFN